jgi:hypothetical protein
MTLVESAPYIRTPVIKRGKYAFIWGFSQRERAAEGREPFRGILKLAAEADSLGMIWR